ncbi:hypothetical protein KC340_g134 [Hortaea werneckii]|nr:hypothetical protein KC340_g134 [Hortaea werneckii]
MGHAINIAGKPHSSCRVSLMNLDFVRPRNGIRTTVILQTAWPSCDAIKVEITANLDAPGVKSVPTASVPTRRGFTLQNKPGCDHKLRKP